MPQRMTPDQIRAHFPRASQSVIDANAGFAFQPQVISPAAAARVEKVRRINKTEIEFSRILDAQKARGEIIEYRYEGMKLAWGEDPATGKPMHYTPDFWVWRVAAFEDAEALDVSLPITIIEVKGGHIFDRDIVRFKGCRAAWPMFRFEMHQKKKGAWSRIL